MLERWMIGAVFAPEGDGMGEGAAPESLMFPSEAGPQETGAPAERDGAAHPPEAKSESRDRAKSESTDPAEDGGKDEAKDEAGAIDPADEIPEDGRYDFGLPEGMAIDEKLAEAMSPVLKDIGLTRGQAQALAGALAAHRQAEAANGSREWADIQTGWVNSAKKDSEIGGARWDASVATAQGALARFGTPGLKAFLTESGGGNHPEVIRFMARVGSAIAEDRPESGGAGAGRPIDAAHLLFPSDKPKG